MRILTEDGPFPYNGLLPLLVYREAFQLGNTTYPGTIKAILEANRCTHSWIDGIYDYHHYHSTAHEILIILEGSCRVQFGGPNGISLSLEKGDVAIVPAGVAHKKIDDADGFSCMGAYPEHQQY